MHRLVQRHRKGQALPLADAGVVDGHLGAVVVVDRARARIGGRHARIRDAQAHGESLVAFQHRVLGGRHREGLGFVGRAAEAQRRRVFVVVRALDCCSIREAGSHGQPALHGRPQGHREGHVVALGGVGIIHRHGGAVVVVDRAGTGVGRRYAERRPGDGQAHREGLVGFQHRVLGGGDCEGLRLPFRAAEAQRRRVFRVVAVGRADVGVARRHLQPALQRIVQRHREGHAVAFVGIGVVDGHLDGALVVVDGARARVAGRHAERRPGDAQAHREGLVGFQHRVFVCRNREGLGLSLGTAERKGRRVLVVVRAFRRRDVGEIRRHFQSALHRLGKSHREGHALALVGIRVIHRHGRAVVVVDRAGARVAGSDPVAERRVRDRQVHGEGFVGFQHRVLGGRNAEGFGLSLGTAEVQPRRVGRVVAAGGGAVGVSRRHRQPSLHRFRQRHREGHAITFGGAGVVDRQGRGIHFALGTGLDGTRARVGGSDAARQRRSGDGQAHREGFVAFDHRVLRGGDAEGLGLVGIAAEGKRRGVLVVVGALGGRDVGEIRRHRQTPVNGRVQRHRKGHAAAFGRAGVVHRHRGAVVVGQRQCGPGHRRAQARAGHADGLVGLNHGVRGRRQSEFGCAGGGVGSDLDDEVRDCRVVRSGGCRSAIAHRNRHLA